MSTSISTDDRNWMEELRTQLTGDLHTQRTRLTELTADTGDPGEAHNQAAMIAAARAQVDQINAALRRLANGSYGRCERCGGVIPRERLEILPHARFCVPCQEKQG